MSKACIGFGCDKVKAVGSSNVSVSVSVRIKSRKMELELDMGLVWFGLIVFFRGLSFGVNETQLCNNSILNGRTKPVFKTGRFVRGSRDTQKN